VSVSHSHVCPGCGSTLSASSAAELAQYKETHLQVVHGSLHGHGGPTDGRRSR
jgi:hypothetical protein